MGNMWIVGGCFPSHSLGSILPQSTCSPSTSVEQTPEPMVTERSCTKAELKSSEPNGSRLLGRKSSPSSPSGLLANFPSGSESGPAKRLVIPKLLMARRMPVLMLPTLRKSLKRKRKRRRRKRKRRNDFPATLSIWSTQLHQLLHKR